jgi:hypothetical protein
MPVMSFEMVNKAPDISGVSSAGKDMSISANQGDLHCPLSLVHWSLKSSPFWKHYFTPSEGQTFTNGGLSIAMTSDLVGFMGESSHILDH